MGFNVLEQRARGLVEGSRWRDAPRVCLFMADGDPSLDAGSLGEKIAERCEALGEPYSARYCYGRAVEGSPEVRTSSVAARERLSALGIDDLLPKQVYLEERSDATAASSATPLDQ